jgi:two-component system NtrC family response regulator
LSRAARHAGYDPKITPIKAENTHAVNCAAIPLDLLKSELLGHVKGASPVTSPRLGAFQRANAGTLMLDEIGDMSLDMQAKLLRVLEDRVVTPVGGSRPEPLDLRIIAATHCNLAHLVEERKFREDLYFRLNVLPIDIPPLRERRADVPVLAQHFLARAAAPKRMALSEAAVATLLAHPWPGNVRELRNAMERVATLVKCSVVEPADLDFLEGRTTPQAMQEFDVTLLEGDLNVAVAALEKTMIRGALEASAGNKAAAARRLGIHRQLLHKKLKQYGLE